MNCNDSMNLLGGYADGELDLPDHVQVEAHLDECPTCRELHRKNLFLQRALADDSFYFEPPPGLRKKILASVAPPEKKQIRIASKPRVLAATWIWASAFAILILMMAIVATLRPESARTDILARELVASHIRSLMADHITDVASSDQHSVKPWFEGRLDFAPPVTDFAPQGFVLVGGRLDYIADRPVAALVYKRRQHLINVFVFREEDGLRSEPKTSKQGYNLVHWEKDGLTFWAVSDLNADELKVLAQLYSGDQL